MSDNCNDKQKKIVIKELRLEENAFIIHSTTKSITLLRKLEKKCQEKEGIFHLAFEGKHSYVGVDWPEEGFVSDPDPGMTPYVINFRIGELPNHVCFSFRKQHVCVRIYWLDAWHHLEQKFKATWLTSTLIITPEDKVA